MTQPFDLALPLIGTDILACFRTMEGLRRLLVCLDCPFAATVNIDLKTDFQKLVVWLEDRKIRELEIHERQLLKEADGLTSFDIELKKYLALLNCPYVTATDAGGNLNRLKCTNWLVMHAVSVEYEDCAQHCIGLEDQEQNSSASADAQEPGAGALFSGLDGEADRLGLMLGLHRQHNEATHEILTRIASSVRLNLTPGAIEILNGTKEIAFTLDDFPLEFDTGDAVVNNVVKVLKMLHLFDFKELQSDLNALIVLGQEYTANPKTNNKLGKVGS